MDTTQKNKTLSLEELKELRHDLKTPLTAIQGYAELLLTKMDETKEKEKKWLQEIIKDSKRLYEMIDTKLR